jgi:Protein of unknown function (DUF3099)
MRWTTARRTAEVPAIRITTARKSVADDQAARVRGYVISMTIRIACFLLAVVTTGVLRWVFVAGALIIPYFAVVFANGGREPNADAPDTLMLGADRELPSGVERRAS